MHFVLISKHGRIVIIPVSIADVVFGLSVCTWVCPFVRPSVCLTRFVCAYLPVCGEGGDYSRSTEANSSIALFSGADDMFIESGVRAWIM